MCRNAQHAFIHIGNQPAVYQLATDMHRLLKSLEAWPSTQFAQVLKAELESLPPGGLPLPRSATLGGYVDDSRLSVTLLDAREEKHALSVKLGVFFSEIMAGCSCGEDPATVPVYCEMQLRIEKPSAVAHFMHDTGA